MWACCADTSSDDGEHNTSNTLLLLFADALIAPVLLTGLSDVDELMVALGCMFALDFLLLLSKTEILLNLNYLLMTLDTLSGSKP